MNNKGHKRKPLTFTKITKQTVLLCYGSTQKFNLDLIQECCCPKQILDYKLLGGGTCIPRGGSDLFTWLSIVARTAVLFVVLGCSRA